MFNLNGVTVIVHCYIIAYSKNHLPEDDICPAWNANFKARDSCTMQRKLLLLIVISSFISLFII